MSIFDVLHLLGALGLFLYGMKTMSDALLELAGSRLRHWVTRLTANRFKGMLSGLTITSFIQSSSATTLMIVSFVTAQLLSLPQAISMIMGANIGTTFTAWLITLLGFKVSINSIALPLVMIGFLGYLSKNHRYRFLGQFVIGFALLFIGLEFLKSSLPALEQSDWFLSFNKFESLPPLVSILIFIFVGTILTLVLQSSSATMAITLVAASQGIIGYESAIAIVLGENIGTTITANFAAIIGSREAKQAALAHLIFNIIGVTWVVLTLPYFLTLVDFMAELFFGVSPREANINAAVGLSLFHSMFNVINTLLLIGFIKHIAAFVVKVIPNNEKVIDSNKPRYLDESLLRYPETAIHCLLREIRYLYRVTLFEVLSHTLNLHRHQIISSDSPQQVINQSRGKIPIDINQFIHAQIIPIYQAVIQYAAKAEARISLNESQRSTIYRLKGVAVDTLHIVGNAEKFRNECEKFELEDNTAIQVFDKLKQQMIVLLRSYRHWDPALPESKHQSSFHAIKKTAKQNNEDLHSLIDKMVRNNKLSSENAVSLMNANGYISHITEQLLTSLKTITDAASKFDNLEQLINRYESRTSGSKPHEVSKHQVRSEEE